MPQNGPVRLPIAQNARQNGNSRQVGGLRASRGRGTHNGGDGRISNRFDLNMQQVELTRRRRGHTYGRVGTTMCSNCRNAGQKVYILCAMAKFYISVII